MTNKKAPFCFCLAIAVLVLAQNVRPQPPSSGSKTEAISAARIERIDSLVTEWMALRKAPALSLAIVIENQMVFAKGYGMSDVENSVAARSDTAFRLASISKSLTATAVMQLVERGKL